MFFFFFNQFNSLALALDPLAQFELDHIDILVLCYKFFFFFSTAEVANESMSFAIHHYKFLPFVCSPSFFVFILFISYCHFLFLTTNNTKISLSSNFFQFVKTLIIELTQTVAKNNVLAKHNYLFIILLFTFMLIIGLNLIGIIPYTFTITSSFALTFFYSLIVFILINITGIFRTGFLNFFVIFLPNGTPLNITFLLLVIEVISYFARLFSLSIRLFANMMAGHTLLKTLIGFSFTILFNNLFFAPFAFIPWLLVTIIFVLEILIAFLQGYVYLVLFCIYINDLLAGH